MDMKNKLFLHFKSFGTLKVLYYILFGILSMFYYIFRDGVFLYLLVLTVPYLVLSYKFNKSMFVKVITFLHHVSVVMVLVGFVLMDDPSNVSLDDLKYLKKVILFFLDQM